MSKYYITTSIAYVNGAPHIGFALESIQADVLARYHKSQGDHTFFQTGTDEHGVKIVRAAEAAGETPADFVTKNAKQFEALKSTLNLSWDVFVRTSDKELHWPIAQELWKKLAAVDDLYEKEYEGLYCVGHEAFVTEKDLENGICRDHKAKPEVIKEKNWFFRLSKYTAHIKKAIESGELQILPETRKNEILALLNEGLEDVSFSRPSKDLSWGIPVPGDDTQTMYVWADALSNYIDHPEHWPAEVHLIGKDILRFHAAIWPGMLLSAGLPLPKSILVHGHITVGGEKMSKTVGNVIDPFLLTLKYGADAVRYYLLREIPSGEDGDFSYEKFETRYNGDLANGLGNFAARTLTLGEKLGDIKSITTEDVVTQKIKDTEAAIAEKLAEFKIHEAIAHLWELVSFGDKYINEHKPWVTGDAVVIANALNILENVAKMLTPFLPETSQKMLSCFERGGDNVLRVKKPAPLFPRLSK